MSSLAPYLLPDGRVQIAFSGGRTSAYMLHQILEANSDLPDRVIITFQNTGLEAEETLEFISEVSRRWQVEVVWLEYRPVMPLFEVVGFQGASRRAEPFWHMIKRKKYLPNQQARFCTVELKIRTAKRYLVSLGWERWINCAGLRADEPHRLNKPPPKDRWTVWTPLADAGVSKHDVAMFWRSQPFDLQLDGVNGKTPEGNCLPCFLKSERTQAAMAHLRPWAHAEMEAMETYMDAMWPSLTPFGRLRRIVAANEDLTTKMREAYGRPIPPGVIHSIVQTPQTAGRFSKRFSKAELRRFVEDQGDWILSDEAGLCQADDGECAA